MSSMEKKQTANFGSRFGYIMVAAGAAIGLGNIWKFPYLAYGGGGGAFIVIYLIFVILLGRPVCEMENAIGRYARTNAIDAYGVINPKYKFIGAIQVLCTVMIDMYYIIVSGYVLKYAIAFLMGGNFGADKAAYYYDFISQPITPLIYAGILMLITVVLLANGITNYTMLSRWVDAFRVAGPEGLRPRKKGRKKTLDKSTESINTQPIEEKSLDTSAEHVKELEDELLKLRIENAFLKELRRLRLEDEAKMRERLESSAASEDSLS